AHFTPYTALLLLGNRLRALKNRVAAQSARDRKKARMTELEQQVVELEEENQKLLRENQLLRERTCNLVRENQELRCRLGLDALKTEEEEGDKFQIRLVTGSAESAALRLRVPLQQVQAQQSPFLIASTWILVAVTLQTLSLISYWAFWTVWTQRCFSDMLIQSQRAWKSWRKRSLEKQIPYQPPCLPLWGPHQLSWKPLMNS
uniref:X-box-binding protein 1 n=1 Tax=Corvus moneduloides TaxID=1196302 RepID=A0A8C3H0N8_CORMO